MQLSWLDRRATHQRLPSSTTSDGYGDESADYDDLASDVPIRIEQPEVDPADAVPGDVVRWTGWILGTAAEPKHTDRFVIVGGPTVYVDKVEDLTDFDGNLDHWQMAMHEIDRRTS